MCGCGCVGVYVSNVCVSVCARVCQHVHVRMCVCMRLRARACVRVWVVGVM